MMEPVRVVLACHPRWDGVVSPLIADPVPELRDASLLAWERLVDRCLSRSVHLLVIAGELFHSPSGDISDRLRHALHTGLQRLARGSVRVAWLPTESAVADRTALPELTQWGLTGPPAPPGFPPLLSDSERSHAVVLKYHVETRDLEWEAAGATSRTSTNDSPGALGDREDLAGDRPRKLPGRRLLLQLTTAGVQPSGVATGPLETDGQIEWQVPDSPDELGTVIAGPGVSRPLGPLLRLGPTEAGECGTLELELNVTTDPHGASRPVTVGEIGRWAASPLRWHTVEVDAADLATESDLETACELAMPEPVPQQLSLLQWQIHVGSGGLAWASDPAVRRRLLNRMGEWLRPQSESLQIASLEWRVAPVAARGELATEFLRRLAERGVGPGAAFAGDPTPALRGRTPELLPLTPDGEAWARLLGLAWLTHAQEDAA